MPSCLPPQTKPVKRAISAFHLAQAGAGDSGGLGPVSDDPGRLPFLGIEHHAAGQIRGPGPR